MALAEILQAKRQELEAARAAVPQRLLERGLEPSDRSFLAALKPGRTRFILECKKASPSLGIIRPNFDPAAIAQSYAPFADAISVLTDGPFFQGSADHLAAVRAASSCPILNKDFILDPYQVVRARRWGADAVLLMLSVLDDDAYARCRAQAEAWNMGFLTEVHSLEELKRAFALNAPLIGINNRDLATLRLDLAQTERLAPLVPENVTLIAESGLRGPADVLRLRSRVHGFLIGSELMKRTDLDRAVREMIFSPVKVCGLRSIDDARAAWQAGATHGGLIFHPQSPRLVDLPLAKSLVEAVPELHWVGVVGGQPPQALARLALECRLSALQLHAVPGSIDLRQLRHCLNDQGASGCQLWQVGPPELWDKGADPLLDRWVLDSRHLDDPKRQVPFDWGQLAALGCDRSSLVLAGGLAPHNAQKARSLGFSLLDVNSGVEEAGCGKSKALLQSFFAALRGMGKEVFP
jgi:indole-3-glycerol phosphate synthase/phosphoribosylanthranilate isomerase